MKSFYRAFSVIILATFTLTLYGQYEWIPITNIDLPDGWGIGSISTIDEDTTWALAGKFVPNDLIFTPKVFRTTDGGQNWEEKEMTGVSGRATFKLLALDGFSALITTNDFEPWYGPNGAKELYKTSDGGDTWQVVLQNNAGGLHLHFFDPQNGIGVNQDDIAYTEDGGDSWTLVDGDSIPDLNPNELAGLFYYSTTASSLPAIGDTVWMGTDQGRIFRSTNRGRSWEVFDTGLGNSTLIFALAFSDHQNGLLGYGPTENRRLARTTDGGMNWEPIAIPAEVMLRELIYVPGTESTFVGASFTNPKQTAFLSNYGADWIILDDAKPIFTLEFANINLGYGSGSNDDPEFPAEIYKWAPITNTAEDLSKLQAVSAFPNPFISELTIQSEELTIRNISFSDVNGKVINIQNDLNSNAHSLVLPDLPAGVYFLNIETDKGRLIKKVLKE